MQRYVTIGAIACSVIVGADLRAYTSFKEWIR
jgi:hypothetical protein